MKNSRLFLLLSIMVISAFLMGCLFIFIVNPYPGQDFGRYQRLGRNLILGHGYSEASQPPYTPAAVRMPMYPLFLAMFYRLFGFNDTVVFLWQAVLYALTALFLYLTARELFKPKIALLSGFLFALYPISAYWVGVLYAETLVTFLLISVTLFLVRYFKYRKISYLCWASILTGMLILTRPLFGLYPLAILCCLFLLRLPWKKLILHSLIVIILASAVVSPWIIRNFIVYHKFIPLIKGYGPGIAFYLSTIQFKDNWHGLNQDKNPLFTKQKKEMISEGNFTTHLEVFPQHPEASAICWKYGIKNVLDEPLAYIFSLVKKIPRLYMPMFNPAFSKRIILLSTGVSGGVLLLGIIGIYLVRKLWKELIFLFLPLIYITGIYLPFFITSRYSIPGVPYLMVFAALVLGKLFFKGEALLNAHK